MVKRKILIQMFPMESGGSVWLGNYMGEVILAQFIVVVINFTENMLLLGAPRTQSTSQKQIKRLVKQY
jgi:hypothetical protein